MKKIILLSLILLFLPSVSAVLCDDRTSPIDIPCGVVTPVITCANFTYNLINITSNTTLIANGVMLATPNGTYNFTFNQPLGDYQIILCDASTATITVAFETGTDFSNLYWLGFLIFVILIGLGFWFEDPVFTTVAGFLAVLLALAIFILGFPGFTDRFILNSFSVVLTGIGLFFIIAPYFNEIMKLFGGGK